jgi:dUTP pyrophosphatase
MFKHAKLFLCISNDDLILHDKYTEQIQNHNESILNSQYPNSGFDVYFPQEVTIDSYKSQFVKMNIICEMHIFDEKKEIWFPVSYYSYPRSSISKTPLMLANSAGIIDSGYRGQLIGAFRNIASSQPYTIEKYSRLLQICAPDLRPIYVELVTENFFEQTERGSGGFGSTGK